MNYRIYVRQPNQNDQLGANGRDIIIVAVGDFTGWVPTSAGTIANAFSNNGWSLGEPGIQTDWANGTVQIRASVFNTFSNQEILNNATKILNPYFTVTDIELAKVRDADIYNVPGEKQVSGVFGNTKTTNTNSTKTNTANKTVVNNTGGNNANAGDEKGFADYISEFFNSLGSGLGMTTPIVGAGLLILTIVILKR